MAKTEKPQCHQYGKWHRSWPDDQMDQMSQNMENGPDKENGSNVTKYGDWPIETSPNMENGPNVTKYGKWPSFLPNMVYKMKLLYFTYNVMCVGCFCLTNLTQNKNDWFPYYL